MQFRNQRGGIRSGRIAESDDSGKLQGRWRTHRDGEDTEALRFEVVRRFRCIGRGWRQGGNRAKAPSTARRVAPPAPAAVAADIFVPRSNGVNLISFGRSD